MNSKRIGRWQKEKLGTGEIYNKNLESLNLNLMALRREANIAHSRPSERLLILLPEPFEGCPKIMQKPHVRKIPLENRGKTGAEWWCLPYDSKMFLEFKKKQGKEAVEIIENISGKQSEIGRIANWLSPRSVNPNQLFNSAITLEKANRDGLYDKQIQLSWKQFHRIWLEETLRNQKVELQNHIINWGTALRAEITPEITSSGVPLLAKLMDAHVENKNPKPPISDKMDNYSIELDRLIGGIINEIDDDDTIPFDLFLWLSDNLGNWLNDTLKMDSLPPDWQDPESKSNLLSLVYSIFSEAWGVPLYSLKTNKSRGEDTKKKDLERYWISSINKLSINGKSLRVNIGDIGQAKIWQKFLEIKKIKKKELKNNIYRLNIDRSEYDFSAMTSEYINGNEFARRKLFKL